jgi:hypothetical protein
MKSEAPGKNILEAEVTNISRHGLWILLSDGEELFLSFSEFPWFKSATLSAILDVERPYSNHLYWPQLDVDLTLDCIRHPEKHPLVSKIEAQPSLPADRPEESGR